MQSSTIKHPFQGFDKQIYFIKIIIGEACPLRCSYCFVDKEDNRTISEENIFKFIELLLYSPGHNKLLHLLGGEPLLCFDLIKKAISYARKLEKKLGKDLDISFCTSGIYFDQEKLDFIHKSKIFLAWSIDGPEYIHNKNRKLANNKGSFQKIIQKKEMVRNTINDTHLGIAMTIDQNVIHELFNSYIYLVEQEGFNCTINLAPVDGVIWSKEKRKKFITEIEKIHQYIFDNIAKGNFYYLNSLNKEFRFNMLSVFRKKGGRCLWFYTEGFTNGDVVFNAFINKEEDYSRFLVGNIGEADFMEKVKPYLSCKFDPHSQTCIDCRESYFGDMDISLKQVHMNHLLEFRDRISVHFANKIRFAAKNKPLYQKYIELAKDYMYV